MIAETKTPISPSSPTSAGRPATALPAALTAAELDGLQRSGDSVTVVDVRSPAEFESVHIPGSYNVPLDQLSEHRAEFGTIGEPLVLVCRSGMRARQAEQALQEADIPRLHVLEGGVSAWETAGLSVTRGRNAWSIERQVRAIAGGMVLVFTLGSVLVWQPLLYLAMFVGAGLFFAGITDTCAMGMLLMRMPWNRGATCDVSNVMAQLQARSNGGNGGMQR